MSSTSAKKWQPLDMQRVIRDDGSLNASEKGLLAFATLRTDNMTRRVKASLQCLAKDAGLGYRTARRAFEPSNAKVLRYFSEVERGQRFVNLTFAHHDEIPEAANEAVMVTGSTEADLDTEAATVSVEAAMVADSGGHGGQPSASSASTSASTTFTPEWIEENAPSFEDDPPESENKEPTFHVVDHQRPASTLPDWKQRQHWEQSLAQDEGLDKYGEPLDGSRAVERYSGRRKA